MEIEQLKEFWRYQEDSKSGLIWIVKPNSRNGRKLGEHVGNITMDGYYSVTMGRQQYLIHRVVWEINFGPIAEGLCIDHIDGNRLNNRIENLRLVTKAENARNAKYRPENKSGIKGVFLWVVAKDCGYKYEAWRAIWTEVGGGNRSKSFNVEKYGYDEAFRLACEYRLSQINRLNLEGAGYTERHLME